MSRITYPNGTLVDRNYTARGQLQGVGWGAGATSYVYWPDGKVKYQARINGVTTDYGYDGRGMISWVRHRLGDEESGHEVAKRAYWRDNRDRIVAWKRGTDATYNQMEDGRGNRYKYYDDGQLERAWYRAQNPETDNPLSPARGDHFYYDALGNRTGWNEVASRGAMLFNGKNNGLNQYFSWNNSYPVGSPQHWGTTTNYDDDVGGDWGAPGAANGVLMQDGYITAGYNALNQPVSMWGKSYFTADRMWFGYDPLGRLVKRWKSSAWDPNTTAATFFYYDGTDLVQEGPSAGIASNIYVHGGRIDEIVASQVSGVWYNHHYDAQGNCILLSNAVGGIEQQYDYDAFGFPYFYTAGGNKAGSPKTRFLFTGREWIVDMRVYDFRARMYQPELGRFLQPDPVEFAASDYNLYRYCHNDPVNKSDPTGLREELAGEILRDRMWDSACRTDSGNSFQGSLQDFVNRLHNRDQDAKDASSGGKGIIKNAVNAYKGLMKWVKSLESAAIMTSEFATGRGKSERFFDAGSPESEDLKSDPQYAALAARARASGRMEPSKFVPPKGPINAGLHPIRQFAGTYSVFADERGTFAYNQTTLWSGLYHMPSFSAFGTTRPGPGANITQIFMIERNSE